jgi:hypothetical protein
MNVILTPGGEITIFAGDEEDVAISAAVAVIRMDDKKSRGSVCNHELPHHQSSAETPDA